MPVFQTTQPWTLEQRKQIELIAADANRALASLADPLRLYGQKMQDSLQTIRPQIEILSFELKKTAEKFNVIKPMLSSSLFLPPQRYSQFPNLIPLMDSQGIELIDEPLKVRRKHKAPKFTRYFEEFCIGMTKEGRFYYKNKLLKNISTNSKQGKFLKLLLEMDNNYITDVVAIDTLQPPDLDKGLGYIRDDLIKCLAKDSLNIDIYRNRKHGFKLLKITKVKN